MPVTGARRSQLLHRGPSARPWRGTRLPRGATGRYCQDRRTARQVFGATSCDPPLSLSDTIFSTLAHSMGACRGITSMRSDGSSCQPIVGLNCRYRGAAIQTYLSSARHWFMSESPVEHFEHAEHAALMGDPFLAQVAVTIAILAVIAATAVSRRSKRRRQ